MRDGVGGGRRRRERNASVVDLLVGDRGGHSDAGDGAEQALQSEEGGRERRESEPSLTS